MRRIAVFCGATSGVDPAHVAAARLLGATLAARGLGLVTGGGRVGLMGEVADASLAGGGEVIGVIPRHLVDRELAHPGLSQLVVVESLAERKATMVELSDGFIALPGGIGTLDELAEVLSWAQLGLHGKPTGILDAGRYWEPLLSWLDASVAEGYVTRAHRDAIVVTDDPDAMLDAFAAFRAPGDRWEPTAVAPTSATRRR
jgi:uncharacterized protein (TIGR00730 family)